MSDSQFNSVHLTQLDGDIVCVTLDVPGSSANILSEAMLSELELRQAEIREMDGLRGLILVSAKPRIFVAGANLKEIRRSLDWTDQQIEAFANRGRKIFDAFGQFDFPSVAAVHGACVGGGLELALGCDRRIATTERPTIFGLPETKLGLIPGWAGTVRVPRIVGLEEGLRLVVKGETFSASIAKELGIVDSLVPAPADLIAAATTMIEELQQAGNFRANQDQAKSKVPVQISDAELKQIQPESEVESENYGFAQTVVRDHIIASCQMGFEEACAAEEKAFAKTWGSDESHGMLNLHFLSQRNRKNPGFVDLSIPAETIKSVGVVGAGLMGRGIAQSCLNAGCSVLLYDTQTDLLESVVRELEGEGKTITAASDVDAFADCDLVIETIVESLEVKQKVLEKIEAACHDQVIIASNTSSIPITELADSLARPERVCGIHFCHPRLMKLVEVVRGELTSEQTVTTATQFVRGLRKLPVVVKDGPGFVVNRLLSAMLDQAVRLATWGVSFEQIDRATRAFGFDAGPFEVIDIIGADTCLNAGLVMGQRGVQCVNDSPIVPRMVKRKRLGRKTGLGFYRYSSPDSLPEHDPAVENLLEAFCQESPAAGQQSFDTPEQIADLILSAMVQEASRILSEGLVADPGDIDLCMIHGLAFPARQGGLLFWAKRKPVQSIIDTLNWLSASEARFEPSEFLLKVQAGVASL